MKDHKFNSLLVALGLLLGYIVASPGVKATDIQNPHSEKVTELLASAETEAIELKHDADLMNGFARSSQLSWVRHRDQITLIKDHVNQTGKLLAELKAIRESAAPWQQQAIDQIEPLLRTLAATTEATINHLKEHQSGVQESTYKDYALANYQTAEKLAALISDFVDYEKAAEELEALQQKLALAES